MNMPFQPSGRIRNVPLPELMQGLSEQRASGTLSVHRGPVRKSIFFKHGQIIFAISNDVQDRLGEVLVKSGFLTRENLEVALDLYRRNAGLKKIGAILVENGFVSPKQLFTGLKTQVKDIIYSLFLWDDAEYRFEERLAPDVIQLQLNLKEMIAEIVERIKREM